MSVDLASISKFCLRVINRDIEYLLKVTMSESCMGINEEPNYQSYMCIYLKSTVSHREGNKKETLVDIKGSV